MIENISIYPEIVSTGTRTINYKIVRRFDIVTNEKVIEIWQDESIAKHNYVEILSLVNFIKTNTNLKINVIDKFDEKMIELLKRQGNEAEMINEFRHLHSAVHGRM
ncbi:hypothetical protein AGMMS50267_04300 [Spirochaetia bacterium]|nr:hypothetical protein AGMMS50267_04300 [Spirochaetia bacterium]